MAYIGVQPAAGQYRKLDDISAGFNGTSTTFTTSVSGESVTAGTAQQLLVSIGGVIQEPKTDYDVSTNSIVFTTAPAAGLDFFAVLMGDAVNTITVPDGSVTTAKLAGSLSVGLAGGTNSAPTLFFTGDTNTGVYSPGADQVAVTTGGTQRLLIDASGNVNVDSNTLYVAAANNRVGIGTSSVSRTLDVVSTDTWIRTARTGGNAWIVGTGVQDAYRIYDDTAGAERFRIDTSGRVGIGTTPTSIFHVKAATNRNFKIDSSGGSGGTDLRISALNDADSANVNLQIQGDQLFFAAGGAERARIDSSGRLLVGTSSARSNDLFGTSQSQVEGTDAATSSISIIRNVATAGAGGIALCKSRSSSIGGVTVVQSGDVLGFIDFQGADGTDFARAATIAAEVDGTPGNNDMPGRLVFSTTADGASFPTERMRIASNGNVYIGGGTSFGSGGWTTQNSGEQVNQYSQTSDVRTLYHWSTNNNGTNTSVAYVQSDGKIYARTTTLQAISSERRLKENIVPLNADDAWETVKSVPFYSYNFIGADPSNVLYGPMADEVPDEMRVATSQSDDVGVIHTYDNGMLQARLYVALQAALNKIETLEAKVAALESA